ncbi:MAG: hypothetical protein AAF730_07425 [Bacteroidota bacterium]
MRLKGSEVSFQVVYEGAALEAGTMSVRQLAPALLALSDLVDQANTVVNGTTAEVTLQFQATQKGSLEVHLGLLVDFLDGISDFFSGDGLSTLDTILSLLGISGAAGLFQLIKKLRGKAPAKVLRIPGTNRVRIEFGDEVIETDARVLALYQNRSAREQAHRVIEPLDGEAIRTFVTRYQEQQTIAVTSDEAAYFEPPAITPQALEDNVVQRVFSVVALSFKEDNKWRLSDGENTYSVRLLDQAFVDLVQEGRIAFSKRDLLRVNMRTRQWKTEQGLRTEYEIVNVLEHLRDDQIDLPFA